MIIKLKEFPKLHAVVRRAFPSYRKHSAIVRSSDVVTPYGCYWDGGSKNAFYMVHVSGKVRTLPPGPRPFVGGESEDHTIPSDCFAVNLGTFQGKTATISIIFPNDPAPSIAEIIPAEG